MIKKISILVMVACFTDIDSYTQETKPHHIGTGFNLQYVPDNISFMIDAYFFFNSKGDSYNRGLTKIGMGFNKDLSSSDMGYRTSITIGIGAISIIPVYSLYLKSFGLGASVDYSMVAFSDHGIGGTFYMLFDMYLLGFGVGAVLTEEVITGSEPAKVYGRFSFAIVF